MVSERNVFPWTHGNHTAKKARNGQRKRSTRPHVGEQVRDRPLVEQDDLFFRVIPGVRDALAHQDFDADDVALTFRAAFTGVWERIPPADRQRLLVYWRHGPDSRSHEKKHGPLIQVVCQPTTPEVVLARCGMEISFPATLVIGQPHRLLLEIARTLAQVYRLATREHWGLVLEQIEEPLQLWERHEGARATESQRDKLVKALEAEYLEKYEASVLKIVRAWRLGTPEV